MAEAKAAKSEHPRSGLGGLSQRKLQSKDQPQAIFEFSDKL